MDRHTSIFLDLARFGAAMVVFLGHAAGKSFTGGLFWQFSAYLETAVMVFFVLSGYVIGYVTDTRETTGRDFAAARLARLYSVVIPALLLTLAVDAIGLRINPTFYYDPVWSYGDNQTLRYLLTLLFANDLWTWSLSAGSNAPFWSLSYEASYYLLFGLYFFLRGPKRWALLVLVALIVGPSVLSRLPIWLMGFWAYHAIRRHGESWSVPVAILILLVGLMLLAASPLIREGTHRWTLPLLRPMLISDYTDGIGFALTIMGFAALPGRAKALMEPFGALARYVGSLTFALYLFHRPLIMLVGAISLGGPASPIQRIVLLCGSFLVVMLLGRPCERAKAPLKRALLGLFAKFGSPSAVTPSA